MAIAACSDRPGILVGHEDRPSRSSKFISPALTAGQQTQFQKCAYVYEIEAKLRECLVIVNGWEPASAQRAISYYEAQLQQVQDSMDSAARERARLADAADRAAAQERRRLAAADAAQRWRAFAKAPWIGSKSRENYYRVASSCLTALEIPPADRIYFQTEEAARAAGYLGVAERGCY